MTVQVTVRIADDAAEFLDRQVASGTESRATVITRALRREARRQEAERDAEIYFAETRDGAAADDQWARWAKENAARVWADLD